MMKNESDFDVKKFMQRVVELAQDESAGQPHLRKEEILAGSGKNTSTLDEFIKQRLMPNAQKKRWTRRQAHLFQGLCALEPHNMTIRRQLLTRIWIVCGEQYGITLAQVKQVMRDWAATEAKLPKVYIPLHARSVVCWGERHINREVENKALRKLGPAYLDLYEKRQEARSMAKGLPLAHKDYKAFREQVRPGLDYVVDAIREREVEEWKVRKNDQWVEQVASMLMWYEYSLDCLQSEQEGFSDDVWYWARALQLYAWGNEPRARQEPLDQRLYCTCQMLAATLAISKDRNLTQRWPERLQPQQWQRVRGVEMQFGLSESGQAETKELIVNFGEVR
jgi:hypothetical protein